MQRIIKKYEKEGYIQITTTDERFYIKPDKNGKDIYYPSVTWICDKGYVKGIAFYKYLAQKGWDESESLKEAAGARGSKIHSAIVDLLDDKEVKIDSKYFNELANQEEELTSEEYEAIMSFIKWWETEKPELIAREFAVFNEERFYAGTVDLLCKIKGKLWLIDFKTGQAIWPSYELQLSAYRHALMIHKELNLAILQIGYFRNKNKYKFTELQDKFHLFIAAQEIWKNECEGISPKQIELPLTLRLGGE